jgi:hypothetical protein
MSSPRYNTDSLRAGMEKCKVNIKTFEDAIQKERDTINEYYDMIEVIKKQERESNLAITLKVE